MRMIRRRAIVDDDWLHVPDGDPVPAGRQVTVSLERWLRAFDEGEVLPSGVRVAPGDAVERLAGLLDRLELIVLEFGAFTEGRGFSQARLLRERLGFAGELRAAGAVTRDRIAFMERCGIDAFELAADEDPREALSAFAELALPYQPAADGAEIVARRRGWRAAQ